MGERRHALWPTDLSEMRTCLEAYGDFSFLVPQQQKSPAMRGNEADDRLRLLTLVIESLPERARSTRYSPQGIQPEELKWGMSRAGVKGDYLTSRVTHDEVDDITSALVGLFYWRMTTLRWAMQRRIT